MIIFEENTINEAELREYTKHVLGIRYRKNKKGEFIAYSNIFTTIGDIYKKIRNKIKTKKEKTENWDSDEIFLIRYQALSKAQGYMTGEAFDSTEAWLKKNEQRYITLNK